MKFFKDIFQSFKILIDILIKSYTHGANLATIALVSIIIALIKGLNYLSRSYHLDGAFVQTFTKLKGELFLSLYNLFQITHYVYFITLIIACICVYMKKKQLSIIFFLVHLAFLAVSTYFTLELLDMITTYLQTKSMSQISLSSAGLLNYFYIIAAFFTAMALVRHAYFISPKEGEPE